MLFSSIPFIYYFLTATLILYFLVPMKLKNTALLIMSLVFYGWGEPEYIKFMVIAIIGGYVCGILIEKFRGKALAKAFMAISAIISLGMLGYFKYADFFIANFNAVTGMSVPLLKVIMPIGISFYTFQILSYTIDVYRGDVQAQKNPIDLAAYISMFPQLIAGPIVRYSDIEFQLKERNHSFENAALGIRRFVLGLAKKILIANALGELCDIFRATGDKAVLFYWLYAIAFALHIYFDFSGYSDMAIGLGKMFGFTFLENFNYPYISKSVTEFWRRWHMSLGSWFRSYVYIPLGGNRVSKAKLLRNIFVVWLLTGFWHGAAWNFIVWGLIFAVLLVIEKYWLLGIFEKSKVLSRVYTLFFVVISFVIFNATDLKEAVSYIGGMFGAGGIPFVSTEWLYYLKSFALILIVAVVGATPVPKKIVAKIRESKKGDVILSVLEPVVLVVLVLMMTAYLVDGSFNPFLYFRF